MTENPSPRPFSRKWFQKHFNRALDWFKRKSSQARESRNQAVAAGQVLEKLTGYQKRMAAACMLDYADAGTIQASHLTVHLFQKYLESYFTDPLAVTRRQNDFIRHLNPAERKPFFRAGPLLNCLVERQAHLRPYGRPSGKTHQELNNVGYLFHGDILPGTHFVLDKRFTHDREYLEIKKNSENALPYLRGARQLATHTDRYSQATTALALMDSLKGKGGMKVQPPRGAVVGAGTVIALSGDVCRHKSAMLTQCLQEAGINAQYVRGDLETPSGGGRHAWVHAELDGRMYRLDPEWGIFNLLFDSSRVLTPSRENPLYRPDSKHNVVWRRKRRAS